MNFREKISKTVDNLKSGAAETASKAFVSADRAIKKGKIQEQIRRATQDLQEHFTGFGMTMYAHRGASQEEIETFLTGADEYTQKLEAFKQELQSIEAEPKQEETAPEAEVQETGKELPLTCPACGHPYVQGQKFCSECAHPLN